MGSKLCPKFLQQLGLHELIVVCDLQRDDAFPGERLRVLAADATQVGFLHEEKDVSPTDVPFGDDDAGAWLGSNRADLVRYKALEKFLRRQAPALVSTADEQELRRAGSFLRHGAMASIHRRYLFGSTSTKPGVFCTSCRSQ